MQERIVLILGGLLVLFACANGAEAKKPVPVVSAPVAPVPVVCNCGGDASACDCDHCQCPQCESTCASCDGPQFRTPVRTFFHNRQPVRRVLRFLFR